MRRLRVVGVALLAAAALLGDRGVSVAWGADELLAGRSVVVRTGALLRVVARPAGGARAALPGAETDPTVSGASLRVLDLGLGGAGDDTHALPAAGWTRLGGAAAVRGYRYRGTTGEPCRTVLVKARLVKAVCRGAAVTLAPPFAGELAVILTIGHGGTRYCATFGGTAVQSGSGAARRRGAPVAAACGGCACGTPAPAELAFTSGVGSGACGTLAVGVANDPLVCGGLYFGGGSGSTPLPAVFPDFANPLRFAVTACLGETLTLGPIAAAAVAPVRSCSAAGCAFGAPIPLPNPNSVPTSTCLYNTIAADARGTAACGAGTVDLDLPLRTEIYLNGDLLPNRCAGGSNPGGRCTPASVATDCPGGTCEPDAGTQSCPVCNPATLVCNGGPRNNLPCVPDGEELTGPPYPTSHDCPSSPLVRLGDIPIALALTTGTATMTAAPSGTQARVFCGYCRDAESTGSFQAPAVACRSNADCAAPYASCEQANQGAFRNAGATEITEVGGAAGALVDGEGHVSTLVSVFCIPPTQNGLIDNSADLPGPGALGLTGTLQLTP